MPNTVPRFINCAQCNAKLHGSRGSLGQGKTVCRVCRRKNRPEIVRAEPPTLAELTCPTCSTDFTQTRSSQIYCKPACRPGRRATKPKAPTSSRGYGAAHQALRKKWKPQVEAGLVDCARCGTRIQPGQPWDLGHTDDRSAYSGPECRTCNRSAGGRRRHELGAPVATDHLKWGWQDCADCGTRCYGRRCIDCHRGKGRGRSISTS